MLSASAIDVDLGRAPVLRGVSLCVREGETVALIGPNGAGKSTLLRALSGAVAPRRGRVALDGRPLADWPRDALARRRAVLPQTPVLSFPFGVLDVVMLGRSPHAGRSRRADDLRAVEGALAETGALHLAGRDYTTLSGGERQRVRLAAALAQVWPEPERGGAAADGGGGGRYVLFDEPTNALDLAHQQVFMEAAKQLARRGYGVLAVFHDPNLAALHADRVCVLAAGRPVADGPPDSVLREEMFESVFGVRVRLVRHPERRRPIVLPA